MNINITMVQQMKVNGYVYMVFNPKTCSRSVKIGRSANHNRAYGYGKCSTVIYQFAVADVAAVEKRIKNAFAVFKRVKGYEFFHGDLAKMCVEFIAAVETSICYEDYPGMVVNATPVQSYRCILDAIACQPMHIDPM